MGVNTELFSVQVREEGVFLVVTAPPDGAPAIEMGQVFDYLAAQQIVEYNRLAVEEAVRAHSSFPVKIADSQKAKPEALPTYVEAMRKIGWGQGDRAMHPEPGKDRYFVTAGGKVDDKNWEPGPDDWALFADMMRGRVSSMRDPKP